jgi:hypothetical protein
MHPTLLIVCSLVFTSITQAAKPLATSSQTVFGELKNQVLSTGSGRVRLMDQTGRIIWQYKGKNVHDCWMLPNGHVLFADGRVTEIDPQTNDIVFQYAPQVTKGGGAFACQRLANGNTVIGENSTGRILEVTPDKTVVFALQVKPFKSGSHHNLRMVRKLKNGNYLVCHSGEHVVREHTPQGKIVFKVKLDNIAFSAVRLPNGHTLVGHIGHITEFDTRGNPVWKFSSQDIPGVFINALCGIHVLPNNHIAIGVYSAYKDGTGTGMFEITRNKTLVWRYALASADRNLMGIQVLDPQGRPLPGDTIR